MQRKIIRCQSEDPFQSKMHLSPDWIVKFLMNPVWLAEHHLTPKEVSFDDYHFESVGFNKDMLDGYYVSEEGGEHIGIFPNSLSQPQTFWFLIEFFLYSIA